MKPRLALLLLALALAAPTQVVAGRAQPLQEFSESGGCRLRGSLESVRRQKEIAAQGSVTWEGGCVGGYIEGPGILRHQGVVLENGRQRRFAFFLTGVARAGLRTGKWRRESFNMYADSANYWTSLSSLDYVDGVAKGSGKFLQARSSAGFGVPFQRFLATIDRDLAAARNDPRQADARAAAAATAPAAEAPSTSAPLDEPSVPTAPRPRQDRQAADNANADADSVAPRAPPPPPAARLAAPTTPSSSLTALRPTAASPAPPAAALSGSATAPDLRHGNLKPLAPQGTRLPAPAPPALPQQQILEQRDSCSVEQINGRVVGEQTIDTAVSQPLHIAGWAADPQRHRSPDQPYIPEHAWIRFYHRGGGPGLLINMPRNTDRPDVARALGHPAYARAGFRITVDPGRLRPGEYTVAILQRFGADLAVCSSIGRLSLR